MPNSLITRLPGATTTVPLLGGGTLTATDRRTEMLRKISNNARRLRGRIYPNANFDVATKGRQDSLEVLVKRGIIPILVGDGATTLHANVQACPARRSGPETITVASTYTSGSYSKGFLGGTAAGFVNPNADDATLTGLTPVPAVVDFTATSNLDTNAVGAARATVT